MTDRAALEDMLGRAETNLGAAGDGRSPAPAEPPAITVENLPGLCMGVSVLTSLSLVKIGMNALTEDEAKALTAALLKNAEAWDLTNYLGNKKVAAALDLSGCVVAIMVPRIIADAKKHRPPAPAPQPQEGTSDAAQN